MLWETGAVIQRLFMPSDKDSKEDTDVRYTQVTSSDPADR